MNKYFFLPVVLLSLSCKMITIGDKQFATVDETKLYRLRLNPGAGSAYSYEMTNQYELKLEVDDKKIDNLNKTTTGFSFDINKDSTGNFLYSMKYDKIQLHTKNGDTETDADADNAALTVNPVEKMLGVLKTASIIATITPLGNVKSVTGYKELTDKIMVGFNAADSYTKAAAEAQWQQFIEKGVIQKGMDQIFKIFPDSAVHIGDKWKLNSKESDALGFNVKSFFVLKEINDGVALLSSRGEISSDSAATQLMGQTVMANLKGEQEGEYEMETKTGMLLKSRITAHVNGTIQMMGREIPVNIESTVNVDGKKIK